MKQSGVAHEQFLPLLLLGLGNPVFCSPHYTMSQALVIPICSTSNRLLLIDSEAIHYSFLCVHEHAGFVVLPQSRPECFFPAAIAWSWPGCLRSAD
jgi:hypothetical protein